MTLSTKKQGESADLNASNDLTRLAEGIALQHACAYIEIGETKRSGTGFLVGADLLVTCAHVIGKLVQLDQLRVYFHHRKSPYAVSRIEKLDHKGDVAILRLTQPIEDPAVQPQKIWEGKFLPIKVEFAAFGFPRQLKFKGSAIGFTLNGRIDAISLGAIRTQADQVESVSSEMYQLYADALAAASGPVVNGMSGGPVVVDGRVIGLLSRVIPSLVAKDDKAQLGTIYAVPIRPVHDFLHSLAPPPRAKMFTPGMAYKPAWYIHRKKQEEEAIDNICTGTPAVLWGPGRVGKTMVLRYLAANLPELATAAESNFTVITVNCYEAINSCTDFDSFVIWLATAIVSAVTKDPGNQWMEHATGRPGSWIQRLTWLMENHILKSISGLLVLAIVQVDQLWLHCRDTVPWKLFDMLKGWSQADDTRPIHRVRVVVEASSTPTLFQQHSRYSPMNGVNPISIADFGEKEIREVAKCYTVSLEEGDVEATLRLTGGHPHMVYCLMYTAAFERWPISRVIAAYENQKQAPEETIFRGEYQSLLDALPKQADDRSTVLGSLRALLTDPDARIESTIRERMHQAGFLRRGPDHRLLFRNKVFRDFFFIIVGRPPYPSAG